MKYGAGFIRAAALYAVFMLPAIAPVYAQDDVSGEDDDLELEALLNVNVTVASKKAESISDAPGAVYVLTQDEIKRTGAINLKELLLRVPSMGISTTALTSRSLPVMRGDNIKINSSHILFLINGRPIREVQEGGINSDLIESFPVDVIDQIEVIRGPGSVLYGSDAFSGVINIKTKEPGDKTVAASVTSHYEPATGGGVMGDVTLKAGDLNVVAAGRYYNKPDWKPEYRKAYFDFSSFDVTTMSFPLKDTLINDDIVWDKGPGCFLDMSYKGLSATASFVKWTSSAFQNNTDVTPQKIFGNLGYKADILDNWKTDVNFTANRTEMFTANPKFAERHSNNLLLENTHFITLFEKLNIVLGGTATYIEGYEKATNDITFTAPLFITSEGNRWAFSGYGQVDYTLLDQIKLFGGLQVNGTKGITPHIAPRLGGIWHPIKEISIKSFYSEAFRLPSINELYMNFNIGLYGDKNLKPEVVKTFDEGIAFQNDRFMVGVNFFHSKMQDIIQQAPYAGSAFFWDKKYQNLGEVTFIGGELEGKWYITKELYLNGSLLYQNNHDSVYNVVPFPDLIGKGGLSYSHERGFTLSLSNAYQGRTPDKFHGKINTKDQGSFNMLNFSSKFEIARLFNLKSRVEPSLLFKIDNIIGNEQMMWEYGGFMNEAIPTLRGREFYIGMNLTL